MNTVNNRGDYCPEHRGQADNKSSKKRNGFHYLKPSQSVYNNNAWRKLRDEIIERDNYTCQLCGSTEGPMIADHIKPHRGDNDLFWDKDNLITLCKNCHDYKTRQEIIERKKERAKNKL